MFDILQETLRSVPESQRIGRDIPDVLALLNVIASIFVTVGVGVGFIFIAFAFLQFVISMGDPKAIERSKNALIWSAIGFGVSLLAGTVGRVLFVLLDIEG